MKQAPGHIFINQLSLRFVCYIHHILPPLFGFGFLCKSSLCWSVYLCMYYGKYIRGIFVSFTLENLCVWTVRESRIYIFFCSNFSLYILVLVYLYSILCSNTVSLLISSRKLTGVFIFRIKICLNFKNELWRDERCQKVVILNKIVKH